MAQVTARRRQRVARSVKAAGETRVEAVISMKVRASVSTVNTLRTGYEISGGMLLQLADRSLRSVLYS